MQVWNPYSIEKPVRNFKSLAFKTEKRKLSLCGEQLERQHRTPYKTIEALLERNLHLDRTIRPPDFYSNTLTVKKHVLS